MQEYVTCAWSLANKYAVCDRSLFTTKWLEWHHSNHCTVQTFVLGKDVLVCLLTGTCTSGTEKCVHVCVCVCVGGGGGGGGGGGAGRDLTTITSEVGS